MSTGDGGGGSVPNTGVSTKLTHLKTTTLEGGGGGTGGIVMSGTGNNISLASGGVAVGSTIMTGGVGVSAGGAIKVATGGTVTTPIALNSAQSTAAIRTLGAGQSTQVRVAVMPTGIVSSSMIKQLEGTGAGRTQITAIPARSVSNMSITVTRPGTQTTYLPRAGVTATQMTGLTTGHRLVTPIRVPAGGTAGTTVTGLTAGGSFVRGTAVSRNSSSPAATVISPATSTPWMTANNAGQVQVVRNLTHPSRQRIITTQGIGNASGVGVTAVSGSVVTPTGSVVQTVGGQASAQPQTGPSAATIQAVSSQATAHSQPQQQQQQTYVATLSTVGPPRQHQATLVYSSNVSSAQSLAQTQQFNPTVATGQRFAVATPLTSAAGTATGARQIRPISLNKPFPTAKLNTTSISIRAPNIPQLTSTLGAGNAIGNNAASNAVRGNTISGSSTANVIPTANLSATRIIQLQQQPGGASGRLTSNVMPIIVNTSGTNKLGLRPPMAAKVQPSSLTITQLGTISKLPAGTQAGAVGQQNVVASIQPISNSSGATIGTSSINTSSTSVTGTNLSASVATAAQLSAATGQLLNAQNIVSSAGGATMVPLAITTRGGAGGNILASTITPIKNASGITVGKVMTQAQLAAAAAASDPNTVAATGNNTGGSAGTSLYIHHTSGSAQPRGVVHGNSGTTVTVATTTQPSTTSVGVVPNTSTVLTSAGAPFLPPGTIYYESVPASTVQVSTGVLSLTTTTVTSSTMSQNQIASSGSNVAISSLPFASHAGNSTTFTVVPSGGGRAIGQLQIPVSNAQMHTVPVRFGTQLTAVSAGNNVSSGISNNNSSNVSDAITVVPPSTSQITAVSGGNSGGPQILIPASHANTIAATTMGSQAAPHMIIPLQTPIKITSGNVGSTAVVSNFIRKRDADGARVSTVAKNLGPTLYSMVTNVINEPSSNNGAAPPPPPAAVGSSFSVGTSAAASSTPPSALTVDALAKKDRTAVATAAAAVSAAATVTLRRADSPASSDGSTTVSANSSPGVEQQIQDKNLAINRLPASGDSAHFNPINELYPNHHTSTSAQQHHFTETPPSSRNSLMEQRLAAINMQRMNGSASESTPRKKSRRSTNDSQQSLQSQTSYALPPPSINNSTNNNSQASTMSASAMPGNNFTGPNDGNVITGNGTVAGNKENAKPMEFVLRRPPNCTLLNGYKQSWKLANNHFQRYSDVRPREERRPTVIDLANQSNALGKINGWKIFHLRSQMEDLCENETFGYEKLSDMLKQMDSLEKNADTERISELLKGNMQRSKIIVDGINEAQNQIMKIFDHKSHISDIINRCASKRNFKKREKI